MTTSHTVSHIARKGTLRTAYGHIDYWAYDALARAERGRAFRSALEAVSARVRATVAWVASRVAAPCGGSNVPRHSAVR